MAAVIEGVVLLEESAVLLGEEGCRRVQGKFVCALRADFWCKWVSGNLAQSEAQICRLLHGAKSMGPPSATNPTSTTNGLGRARLAD